MTGWNSKILKIDLTTHTWTTVRLEPAVYHKYIGGKGLAGYFLMDHITRSWDDPAMPLLIFAGPLVGTSAPTSGRMTVMSRSPLTGTVGDASVGGRFGTELKKAGWDGIIISGQSRTVCGIEIVDEQIVFTDAASLKGSKTSEIYARLKNKGAVASVGPATDHRVRFASIIFDGHYAAGRNGLGTLFGAKNLKYITISGTGKVPVFDPQALKLAREEIFRMAAASPVLMGQLGITNYGTAAVYDLTSSRRMMPTANFRKTFFDDALQANAAAFHKTYEPRKSGCRGCHILCKKVGSDKRRLPEFETMNHFGPLLENTDVEIITRANAICNEMGMDTISAGATLASYAEIENKQLTGDEILALLTAIANGDGIGEALGKGSYEFARSRGKSEASMSVKKLELPAYDPRGAYGMALGYAVSTRGGCHLRAYPIGTEILRKPVPTDRFTFSGKARIVKIAEDANAIIDSLSACKFIFFGTTLEEFARAFTAVTGVESTGQDLSKIGERIYYAERIMNARNGFNKIHDDLPQRFFKEPGSSGNNIEIHPICRDDFLAARSNYYVVRGLDINGLPTKEKAEELELIWNDS